MQTAESTIKPNNFIVEEGENDKAIVSFFDNIVESETTNETEDGESTTTKYTYDIYTIELRSRDNLETEIEANYDKWLEFVKSKDYDETSAEVRSKRDKLLADTDWTQCSDTALSDEEVENYKIYRQALRDITAQEGFPYDVTFPTI